MSALLATVCAAMSFTTVFTQSEYWRADLDQRVTEAAERHQAALRLRTGGLTYLGFLGLPGQPVGTLGARIDSSKHVPAAGVVTGEGSLRKLSTAQQEALSGIAVDGSLHTRVVPGLGEYRLTAVGDDGASVITGLPTADVQRMTGRLVVAEAVIAGLGLAVAGCVCAVVVRRQLRPLGRVAATAAEAARVPLDRGEVTGLSRVPAHDTDPGTEAGQVGVALNHLIDHVETSVAERQRTEELMRRLLADASHELRTPLASIAGYAQLMSAGTGKLDPALAWRRVSAQSARMTALVEDLLLLARLDEGRPLHRGDVNVATLVAEAVWDARAAGSDHLWQVVLRLDASVTVDGDQARLQQVLANLLTNARVHTPARTKVTVTAEATATRCVIRVHDDGPGIPTADLPSIFGRFTRADDSRARTADRKGGTGLGLAIASAITGAHGGRIEVRSEQGDTEFTVLLPLTRQPPQ
ncbi:ATP-binding protein [Streptomyces sp. NPDC006175]|uniref:sensor histidine kinase n=1 Tax=unclassified Streptomyces TaxID=2593676 RepID=UPI0033B63EB8